MKKRTLAMAKGSARRAVSRAIQEGKLTRPALCQRCGKSSPFPLDAHHPNYFKPLDIEWLCKECHSLETHAVRHRCRVCQRLVFTWQLDDDLAFLSPSGHIHRSCEPSKP